MRKRKKKNPNLSENDIIVSILPDGNYKMLYASYIKMFNRITLILKRDTIEIYSNKEIIESSIRNYFKLLRRYKLEEIKKVKLYRMYKKYFREYKEKCIFYEGL